MKTRWKILTQNLQFFLVRGYGFVCHNNIFNHFHFSCQNHSNSSYHTTNITTVPDFYYPFSAGIVLLPKHILTKYTVQRISDP